MLHRLALLLGLSAAVACGGQDIDSGHGTSTGGSGGATATSTASGGGGSAPATAIDVTVVYGSSTATVDLAKLATVDYQGAAVVPLAAVWAEGALHPDTATLQFDFEGDDGFHPSQKSNCAAYPTGAELGQGYILPETRTLVWDQALGFPGCYGVKAVAKVIGLDAP